MKFWKLVSILGGETGDAISVASADKAWAEFGEWLENFPRLVRLQDREKLDHEMPGEFIKKCLAASQTPMFVSADGTIRSRKIFPADREISVVAAFDKYGGDAVEDALEKGSFKP